MNWKTAFRSFYYEHAEEPDDISLDPSTTALLVIDIQNTYLERPEDAVESARWRPFFDRMENTVIPNTSQLIDWARNVGVEVMFARIACHKDDGRDRSLSQKSLALIIFCCPKMRLKAKLSLLWNLKMMKLL